MHPSASSQEDEEDEDALRWSSEGTLRKFFDFSVHLPLREELGTDIVHIWNDWLSQGEGEV